MEREGQRDCGWVREIQRYRKIWVGEREGEMGERESEMEEDMGWTERRKWVGKRVRDIGRYALGREGGRWEREIQRYRKI